MDPGNSMDTGPLEHVRGRPEGRAVMRQSWRDLLFLHWAWDPADVAARLPLGLEPDLWAGRAYVGVVPFLMRRVRPVGLPALPWLSNFRELNLRTYVRDRRGVPGVWFVSLECDQPLAVALARSLFHLNYQHARMAGSPASAYHCQRRHVMGPAFEVGYEPAGPAGPAVPGSLDFFLIERYLLYCGGNGRPLRCGRVWHPPYAVGPVHWQGHVQPLFTWNGWTPPETPPVHACHSPGVDVEIFPTHRLPGADQNR